MNAYFFKMSQAEKNNILDQHKSIYDGFKTNWGSNNENPLFVQDFANDKGGITVNNKGNVSSYTNVNINEADAFTGAKYLPDVSFDFGGPDEYKEGYVSLGERKDMIGDGDDDLEHGTFGSDEEFDEIKFGSYDDEESEEDIEDYINFADSINLEDFEEIDLEIKEQLQEQVSKTLDMFKRFGKY